jgi:hypothetical protein
VASEVSRIEGWIFARFISDVGAGGLATLVNNRISPYQASQGTAYPLVVYSLQAGSDVQGLGTNRVMTRPIYLAKVISRGAPNDAARSAADRIDVLLNVASSVKDGYVFSSRRVQPISFQESDDANTIYRHVGGLFRIECYPSG